MVPLVWNKKNRLFRAFEDVRGRIELNVRLQNDFEPIKQNVIPSDK
jgi:hypothetical protein